MLRKGDRRGEASAAVVLGVAAAATALTYLLIWLLAPRDGYVYILFFERSWIQHTSTFFFWLTMTILAIKHFSLGFERRGYEAARRILERPELGGTLIWSDTQIVREMFEDEEHKPYRTSIAFRRILKALDRLRKTQSTGAVEDYFRTRSDVDAGELETSYASLRYFVWLIPTLGFIGTVMGIGVGIAGFADIIQSAEGFREVQKALPLVTSSLGTAFDTTLLALGLSAIAVFYMSYVLKQQEHLLEEVDNLCFDDVCALFQEHSTASAEIVQTINDKIHLIIQRSDGNRGQLEEVIRTELPSLLAERMRELGGSVQGLLEAIASAATQLASGQEAANARLLAELVQLKQSQERAATDLAALAARDEPALDALK
jgi:biopolymer transport protein ExbB/TolQ